jgi:cytochrome P450
VLTSRTDDERRASSNTNFGHGHKFCLGSSLAKAELVEGLGVLRDRFAHIERTGPAVWRRVGFVQGPVELPLRLVSGCEPS